MPTPRSNSFSSNASSAGSSADSYFSNSQFSVASSNYNSSNTSPASTTSSLAMCVDLSNDPDPQIKAIARKVASSSRPPRIEQERRLDGQVRRPANAFLIYSRWRRENLDPKFVGLTTQEVSKALGSEWKKLSKPQRAYWTKISQKLREGFDASNPSYQYKRLTKKKKEQLRQEDEKRSAQKAANLRQSAIWEAAFGWRESPTVQTSMPLNVSSMTTSDSPSTRQPSDLFDFDVPSQSTVNGASSNTPASTLFNSSYPSQAISTNNDLGLFNAPTLTSSFDQASINPVASTNLSTLAPDPSLSSSTTVPITPTSLQMLDSIQAVVNSLEDEVDWPSVFSVQEATSVQ